MCSLHKLATVCIQKLRDVLLQQMDVKIASIVQPAHSAFRTGKVKHSPEWAIIKVKLFQVEGLENQHDVNEGEGGCLSKESLAKQ